MNQVPDDRTANNPEQQLFSRELSAQILCALQRVTPRERMVFELRHFQGLKLRTVGEILNTSEAWIKNSLFRATKKLRLQCLCTRHEEIFDATARGYRESSGCDLLYENVSSIPYLPM